MLKQIIFAWKLLWREWRQGQWLIIFFALILAVTVMASMLFITNRVISGIYQTSAKVLGAHLILTSSTPLTKAFIEKANRFSLQTAELWQYPSVININNETQLINVQAVSDNYPLFGKPLSLKQGQALIDAPLNTLITDKKKNTLSIGAALFVINREPAPNTLTDAIWQFMPRAVIRLKDVPATHTVLPGSRVDYRLLMTGSPSSLKNFKAWVTPRLKPDQRLLDINNQQHLILTIFNQTKTYVQLVLFICLLLSGTAIYLSARYYTESHQNDVALLRCFGASKKQLISIYCWQLLLIAVVSAKIGITLAYFLQALVAHLFKKYFYFDMPASSYTPIFFGFFSSFLLLFACTYPIIAELPKNSPLQLWRGKISIDGFRNYQYLIILTLILLAYFSWLFSFTIASLLYLDLTLLSIGCMYLASLLLLILFNKIIDKTRGPLQLGLIQIARSPERFAMQVTAYSLVITPLLTLLLLYHGILAHWTNDLPQHAPNYFIFNIGPTDVPTLQQFFKDHDIVIDNLYPMVKGRLISLNNQPILKAIPASARSNNALHRDLNLSEMLKYPADNRIIMGNPWSNTSMNQPLISIAQNMASDLHLKIGDRLTFQINDQLLVGTISNIRSIRWESMHPNFFIIFPPHLLDRFYKTYITSFYLPNEKAKLSLLLSRLFPNATIINISLLLNQIKIILDKATLILTGLFMLALSASILISISIFHISNREKKKWVRLLKILGANQALIYRLLSIEWLALLLSVMIISYVLAKLASWLLMHYLFT